MIVAVTEENLSAAGYIHSVSWKASHKRFCSAEFVERHTPQAQTAYLRGELAAAEQQQNSTLFLYKEWIFRNGKSKGIEALAQRDRAAA